MDTGVFAFASSSNSTIFTPIKRRESTINTIQFNADPEKDWTTARCHRLLRALTSRVAILKKDISRFSHPAKDVATLDKAATSNIADDGWTQARKRIRKTYSARGAKASNALRGDRASKSSKTNKGRRSFIPGEVSIPTPLLVRARGEQSSDSIPIVAISIPDELAPIKTKRRRKQTTIGISEGDFQLTKPLREIRQDTTAVRYTIYEGIYNGLEALLRGTGQEEPERRKTGARSLSAMALRAVPRYVTQQEALLDEYMQETGSKSALQGRDIATEIYDELEGFGTSGNGWPQMRMVVRSHGIEVLADAIRTGLLDVDFVGALVSFCIYASAVDEAQSLLGALVSSTRYSKPKALYDQLCQPVTMLCKFSQHTGRLSFQYRQLAYIISSKSLPVEWLATKDFGSIWTEAIQAPSPGIDNGDVLSFLKTSISALATFGLSSGRRGNVDDSVSVGMVEAVGNTFSSLLTIFLSIILLSKDCKNQNRSDGFEVSIQRNEYFAALLRNSLFCYRSTNGPIMSKSILPLLVNFFIDHEEADVWGPDSDMTQSLLAHLQQDEDDFTSISSTYSDAVMFVCQIARCCGRGASSSGFEYLEHLHLVLEGIISGGRGSNVLMGLIVDSAFTFAQKVPDRKHLDYAADMDAKYCSRGLDTEASLHKISVSEDDTENSGFRWEEGIGEWVTATPAVENAKRKFTLKQTSADESECDTPYRPPPQLRRRLEREPTPAVEKSSPTGYDQEENVELDDHSHMFESSGLEPGRSIIEISSDSEQSGAKALTTPDSEDELAENSLQSMDSSMVEESDDEIELSFSEESLTSIPSPSPTLLKTTLTSNHRASIYRAPRLNRKIIDRSEDWQVFDESFASTTSSLGSNDSNESSGPRREYIDRAPRLGRKALRSSETWQLFDESDEDELSSLSVSSQGSQALQDVTRSNINNATRPHLVKTSLTQTKSKANSRRITAYLSDSEDELCI